MIVLLRIIPSSINALAKSKELENEKLVLKAELTESRVSTMMSQIRPHFIYNTLGSIEQLCELDPPKAGELVHDFAKYLRGNFGELDNPKPILMSQEMEHVRHYISIENGIITNAQNSITEAQTQKVAYESKNQEYTNAINIANNIITKTENPWK